MNDLENRYKNTMNLVGCTMLIWIVAMNLFGGFNAYFNILAGVIPNEIVSDIMKSLVNDVVYLLIFMVPVFVMKGISKKKMSEPFRFEIKTPPYTLAFIIAGVTCAFSFSYINAVIAEIFNAPNIIIDPIIESHKYVENYNFVLQFIAIALVPAFCEEFLFRGFILSNLLPYGKANAIIISSIMFGLMHSNLYQFLYTVVAGVIMGTLYVKTKSIWPSTLMHMANNAISLLQMTISERFDEETSTLIWGIIEISIFAIGVFCIIFLSCKFGRKPVKQKTEFSKSYRKDVLEADEENLSCKEGIRTKNAFKLFFRPTIVMFIVYVLAEAFAKMILIL